MLIPYKTDAPIYHWPFATVGIIVTNVLVSIAIFATWVSAAREIVVEESEEVSWGWSDWLILDYSGIYPWQWITSNFVHADPLHLIFNMIFLWTFSLVVEGKVGWWKYLLIYFGIGIIECSIEQTLMFAVGAEGGSLGASSIVMGLLAICVLWAPRNEFSVGLFIMYTFYSFEMSTVAFAGAYFTLEFIGAVFAVVFDGPAGLATPILHLSGAVTGAVVGLVLLSARRVDCEGFDVLSIWAGREGKPTLTVEQEEEYRREAAAKEVERQQALTTAQDSIRRLLEIGRVDQAISRFRLARNANIGFKIEEAQLLALIKGADAANMKKELRELALNYIETFSRHTPSLRLKLAQQDILVDSRPRRGLAQLQQIDLASLNEKQKPIYESLKSKAQHAIDEGELEIPE